MKFQSALVALQKGAWSSATAYIGGDIVTSGGSSYICILAHTNHVPPNATYWALLAQGASGAVSFEIGAALSDEATSLTTGTNVLSLRMPSAMTLSAVRASLRTVSSSGLVTVDIKKNGVSILSTLLSIDVSEKTSTTAATPAVISDTALTDDAEITFDITVAGTGAKGLKVWLIGVR